MSDKRRKSEYLLSEIGNIDEDVVYEAENYRKKRNPVWLKPLVACACVCILAVGALGVMMGGKGMSMEMAPTANDNAMKEDCCVSEIENSNSNILAGDMISEGRLYFHISKKEALLVDSTGSLLWLYSNREDFFEDFDSGDYVRVGHGAVMESYPGQTYAESIMLVENGDIYSFTDEEWERLSWVFVEPPKR